MTVGEKAVVHIPPAYGYGNEANGGIPPKSELTFEIELIEAYDDRLSKFKWQLVRARPLPIGTSP